jgi:hypothetical protein
MPTQSTDISGNPYAITYAAAGETWTILKKVEVAGTKQGVHSTFADSSLDNEGHISGKRTGVYFEHQQDNGLGNPHFSITNHARGLIDGKGGVEVYWLGSGELVNDGSILGKFVGAYVFGATDVKVENTGIIRGDLGAEDSCGVYILSVVDGKPVIDNSGLIVGDWGILLETGGLATINNAKGGVIKGGTAAIYSFHQVTIENEGRIKNWVVTSQEEDRIVNKGVIDGQVSLRAGDDYFRNKGSTGRIQSDEGNDELVLGRKAEKLLFDEALNALTNVDLVRNFESGKDRFILDKDIFTELAKGKLPGSAFHRGTSADDPDQHIVYDKKSGVLSYDADGSDPLAQVQFAQLDPGAKLKASDFNVI